MCYFLIHVSAYCAITYPVFKTTVCVFNYNANLNWHMRQGASVVWHHSLLLMNSFNKTEAAVFACRLCFLRAFPFISLIGQGSEQVLAANETVFPIRPSFYETPLQYMMITFNTAAKQRDNNISFAIIHMHLNGLYHNKRVNDIVR